MSDKKTPEELAAQALEMKGFAISCVNGNAFDADDVLQEAAIRAWLHGEGLRDAGSSQAWLFRVVRNEAVTHIRKESRTQSGFDPDEHVDVVELGQIIAVGRLAPTDWECRRHGGECPDSEMIERALDDWVEFVNGPVRPKVKRSGASPASNKRMPLLRQLQAAIKASGNQPRPNRSIACLLAAAEAHLPQEIHGAEVLFALGKARSDCHHNKATAEVARIDDWIEEIRSRGSDADAS